MQILLLKTSGQGTKSFVFDLKAHGCRTAAHVAKAKGLQEILNLIVERGGSGMVLAGYSSYGAQIQEHHGHQGVGSTT